jgi:hypothetical protein
MDISDGGTLAGNVISWSLAPFDATTTSVSYTAFAAGGGPLGGTFDGFVTDPQFGVDLPIVGDNTLSGSAVAGAPVAYWPLDEGTGTTAADIIGGQDGTLQADATWGTGRFGSAVQIAHTENGGVQCPGGIVDTTAGSVSLWFNTAADFSDQDGMIFYVTAGGGDGFGDQSEIHINMSNDAAGVNNVQLWAEGTAGDFSILNGAPLNNGAWHHVVATWEQGGNGILYVNGAEQASDPWTGNEFVAAETWMGRPSTADPNGNYRPFDGLIDDVRVYDRVLSAADVGDLFNNPPASAAPAAPSNLVADLFAGQVQLNWSDNSNDEDGFVIARRQGGAGPFIDVLQIGKNRTTTFDSSTVNATSYTYVVRAFNAIGQSANSNEFTILVEAGLRATNWSQYK